MKTKSWSVEWKISEEEFLQVCKSNNWHNTDELLKSPRVKNALKTGDVDLLSHIAGSTWDLKKYDLK